MFLRFVFQRQADVKQNFKDGAEVSISIRNQFIFHVTYFKTVSSVLKLLFVV